MKGKPLGVGLYGLSRGLGSDGAAHVRALRSLRGDLRIVGIADRVPSRAWDARLIYGLPKAFSNLGAMLSSPEVDIVAVAADLPDRAEALRSAIDAGKAVITEFPVAIDLAEAEALAQLARRKGVPSGVALNARLSPEIEALEQRIAEGYVGEVLSASILGAGPGWGETVAEAEAYRLDRRNGATLLTGPVAQILDAAQLVLGDLGELCAQLAQRRHQARLVETDEARPMTSADQVLINGQFASGAPLSLHHRGGASRGPGFLWQIAGTEGELQLASPVGAAGNRPLVLTGGRAGQRDLRPLPLLQPIGDIRESDPQHLARLYGRLASDLCDGSSTAPGLADAVRLHNLVAAVESAAFMGHLVARAGGGPWIDTETGRPARGASPVWRSA
jgi:predicted dehydrogenase